MTSGAFTIQSAPRDAEKLTLAGPFLLKRLMIQASEKLNLDFGADRSGAFLRDPVDKRAQDVLKLLLEIDKLEGAPVAAPAPAAALPAAAAPPAAEKVKRDPKPASNGAATNGAANHANHGNSDAEGLAILQGIAAVINEMRGSLEAMASLVKNAEKSSKRLEALEAMAEKSFKLQNITLGVVLQLAETSLGAPAADVLEQVASDFGSIEPAITKLISGK